jgi:hypothetical protein
MRRIAWEHDIAAALLHKRRLAGKANGARLGIISHERLKLNYRHEHL